MSLLAVSWHFCNGTHIYLALNSTLIHLITSNHPGQAIWGNQEYMKLLFGGYKNIYFIIQAPLDQQPFLRVKKDETEDSMKFCDHLPLDESCQCGQYKHSEWLHRIRGHWAMSTRWISDDSFQSLIYSILFMRHRRHWRRGRYTFMLIWTEIKTKRSLCPNKM